MTDLSKKKKIVILAAANLLVLLIVFVCLEGMLAVWYRHPPTSPPGLLKGFRHYYMAYGREIIQYRPDYARFDPEVSYLLKPADFRFANAEFDAFFSVNTLGVRDDEASLQQPDVVVLGDSHAMGWGVGQDETFAQIIEKKTGLSVLNAAISSFATAREMRLLKRIDTSKLRYLIVQYCSNDYEENKVFVENRFSLPTMSETAYQAIVKKHLIDSRYYFGKYVIRLLPSIMRHSLKAAFASSGNQKVMEGEPVDAVGLFLKTLCNSGVDLTELSVIVFEINEYNNNDAFFITSLAREMERGEYRSRFRDIAALDLSSLLTASHYYRLDDHMNPQGHMQVADAVINLMKKSP